MNKSFVSWVVPLGLFAVTGCATVDTSGARESAAAAKASVISSVETLREVNADAAAEVDRAQKDFEAKNSKMQKEFQDAVAKSEGNVQEALKKTLVTLKEISQQLEAESKKEASRALITDDDGMSPEELEKLSDGSSLTS